MFASLGELSIRRRVPWHSRVAGKAWNPAWKKYVLIPLAPNPTLRALFEKAELIMRRPKGVKTRKSVAKRFKITATGKVMRMRAGKRHLMAHKKPDRRRSLGTEKRVDPTDVYRIKQNLPFSH